MTFAHRVVAGALAATLAATPVARAEAPADAAPEDAETELQPAPPKPEKAAGRFDLTVGKAVSAGSLAAIHGAAYTFTYFAWYRGRALRDHIVMQRDGWFGARRYAGGADKFGHGHANYAMARGSIALLEAGGWDRDVAAITSAVLTTAFFTMVEIKDGLHVGYGFSIGDTVFNLGGVGLAVAMAYVPRLDDMFDFRLEYWPTKEFRHEFAEGGVNAAEDYSGMTFEGVYHLNTVPQLQARRATAWLRHADLMVGFGTRGYLPIPDDEMEPRTQEVFLGVSLNVQGLLREYVWGRPRRDELSGRRVVDGTLEMFTIPYTYVPALSVDRSRPPDPMRDH